MATTIPFTVGGFPVGASNGTTFSASTTVLGSVFIARKTGSIDRVVIRCSVVTGVSPVYEARIETLTAGSPSGSLWSANTNITWTPVSATTHTLTLTSPASVTAGNLYALVIRYSSGTINVSNAASFLNFNTSVVNINGSLNAPAAITSSNSGTSYSRTADAYPSFAAMYSDGDIELGSCAIISSATANLQTTGITDIGCRFTAPTSCSLVGAWVQVAIGSSNIPTLTLLDMSSSTLGTQVTSQMAGSPGLFLFETPVSLTDGADYRLVLAAATSTALGMARLTFANVAARSACCGDAYYTSRTSGSWTDATDIAPAVFPVFASPTSSGSSIAFNPVVRLPC